MNPLKTIVSALIFVAAASSSIFAASPVTNDSNKRPISAQPVNPVNADAAVQEVRPDKKEEAKPVVKKTEKKKFKLSIKDNIKANEATMDGGGIYISVGALILILILLIIFL